MDWQVPSIKGNAHCQCGYNLRGLTFDHACPECGRAVLDSVRFSIEMPHVVSPQARDEYARLHQLLGDAADASGFTTGACWLVKCAVSYAMMRCREPGTVITAGMLCRALREYARLRFGGMPAAMRGLLGMNITSSEDVGRIVYGLVASGLLQPSPGDSPDDFNGLFTLENFQTVHLS